MYVADLREEACLGAGEGEGAQKERWACAGGLLLEVGTLGWLLQFRGSIN